MVVVVQAELVQDEAVHFPARLIATEPQDVLDFCSNISRACDASDNIVLDASALTFIDPFGLAMLRATMESVDDKYFHVRYMHQGLIDHLVRMEFFQGLEVEGFDAESARNFQGDPEHCVELIRVQQGNSEAIASRLIQAMTGLKCDEQALDEEQDAVRRPIEYALKELLENSLSHAKKEGNGNASVWVACQHFSDDIVRLAIVDNGCGFLATLRDHAMLKEKTHLAAIEAALIERVSCNRGPNIGYETDSQNQGVGLTTTARIAAAASGHLIVASGDAWVRTDDGLQQVMTGSSWKGVAIAFTCHREKLHLVKISELLPKTEAVADDEISFD